MEISIQRIDTSLPLPEYQTSGAAAFDFYSRVDMTIEPKSLGFIPSNLIIETPADHVLFVAPRSSTPRKKGLLSPHAFGVVDSDYRGPNDEILIQLYNFTDSAVTIEKGERIAQGLFMPISHAQFVEKSMQTNDSRGGFGSTGN